MKDQKLIYAMKDIDDDLICDAMKRRSSDVKQEGEEAETVYVSAKRRGQLWRYSVTAAAALAIAVGTLFVINYNGGIPDNFGVATAEKTIETAEKTDNGEASATADTDTSSEETQPNVSEAPVSVVPLKEVSIVDGVIAKTPYGYSDPTAIYVDSYPKISLPDFSEEYFTEMSTKEMFEYYGHYCDRMEYFIDDNQIIEIADENTHHGVYNLPDGSVYDINTFTFELAKKDIYSAHRFTVTIGKYSKFGQEYIEYFKSQGMYNGGSGMFYNEEKATLFHVIKMYGGTVMFSSTPDEITSSFYAGFANAAELMEMYEGYHSGLRLPGYFEMFDTITHNCLKNFNYYIDRDKDLWYSEEDDSYYDEDSYEWIPADQWEFD